VNFFNLHNAFNQSLNHTETDNAVDFVRALPVTKGRYHRMSPAEHVSGAGAG
jgi:hypothetical protein